MKTWHLIIVLMIILILPTLASAQKERINDCNDVILYLQALKDRDEKIDFCMHYAAVFYDQEKYEDSHVIAQYVLDHLDNRSIEAKDMLSKAGQKMRERIPNVNPVTIPLGS